MSEQQCNLTMFNDSLINEQGARTQAVEHLLTQEVKIDSLEEDCKGYKL